MLLCKNAVRDDCLPQEQKAVALCGRTGERCVWKKRGIWRTFWKLEKHNVSLEWASGTVTGRMVWESTGMIDFTSKSCWSTTLQKQCYREQGWDFDKYITCLICGFYCFVLNLQGKRPHHKLHAEVHCLYLHVCVQQYLKPPDKMINLLKLHINLAIYRHFLLLLNFELWFRSAQSIVFHSVVVAHSNPATNLKIENYIAELIENLLMVHGGMSSNWHKVLLSTQNQLFSIDIKQEIV